MTTTSALAKELFAWELDAAKKYDDDQYVYTVGEAQRNFKAQIAQALFAATFHKATELYDELQANPDNTREDGIRIVSTTNDTKVLAIPDGAGNELLYAWEPSDKRCELRLFKTKPPLPAAVRNEIDSLINGRDFDLDLLQKAKDLAAPYSIQARGQYVDSDDIEGVIESINKKGLREANGVRFVHGNLYRSRGATAYKAGVPHNSSIASVERIAKVLGTSEADRDSLFDEFYLDFLEQGTIQENEDSVTALMLETLFDRKMGMIKEIVAASEFLELCLETYVSHGDYDREIYVQRAANKDIYVHNNIDRFENVYLLALNGEGNDYESVDIHISKPWHHTLNSCEIYDDEPMSWETLRAFIEYQDENGGTLREDQVVKALLGNEKPGLVGSFNLRTKEFTRGPFFENTEVVSYLNYMIDMDHNAMTKGINGDLDEVGTFVIKDRDPTATDLGDENEIKIDAWLARIGKTASFSM